MEEEKQETLNVDTSSKSDGKSSPPPTSKDSSGEPSQSEIMEKEQQELLHVDTSSKSDEKSSSPPTSKDSAGEPSQSEIMEKEQQEFLHVDTSGDSDEKSSSPPTSKDYAGSMSSSQSEIMEEEKHELLNINTSSKSVEKLSSPPMSKDSAREPSQFHIMKEKKHETLNIDTSSKSDEKSSPPSTSKDSSGESSQSEIMEKEQQELLHVDTSGESDEKSSFSLKSKDSAGYHTGEPSQSEIMEKEQQELLHVDTSGESDEKSSSSPTSKDYAGESIQSKIMEEKQHQLLNVDTSGESDEKSSSLSTSNGFNGESIQSKIMEEKQHELLNVDTSGESDEKSSSPSTSNSFDGVPSQSDMEGEKHKSLNSDTSAESDEKSLVLWRPIAPPIQDWEAKLRFFRLLMRQVFTREPYLKLIYKREGRSSLPLTTEPSILELLAIGSSSPLQPLQESTTSELSGVIEKPSTSKSDLNLDSQSPQKCILTKQAATKTPKDSTNESNSSADDESNNIEAEQSTHSATHTDDDITNPELPDNQAETMESSPNCRVGEIILVVSFLFVHFLVFWYLFPLYPLGLSLLGRNLEHTDTSTPVIAELEEKILDHDETIRALTEYLQQDTPLLKVVALISNASFDKLYTIDIIRNKFARRSGNERVSLYPSFTVLENLKLRNSNHFGVVTNFAEMCQRVYPHDQQVTILADFKIDDDLTHIDLNEAINTLKTTFITANINIKIFLYKPLNEETLEKYIKNVAKNIGESFSQIQIDDIKRHLIEGNCKKAYGYC